MRFIIFTSPDKDLLPWPVNGEIYVKDKAWINRHALSQGYTHTTWISARTDNGKPIVDDILSTAKRFVDNEIGFSELKAEVRKHQ